MSRAKHISFEELAGNFADLLDNVRTEHASIVVEYPTGEKLLIRQYSPSRRGSRKDQSMDAKPAAVGSTRQSAQNLPSDRENVSSVGAVFDMDPGSITPG